MSQYSKKILYSFSCGVACTELIGIVLLYLKEQMESHLLFLIIIPFMLSLCLLLFKKIDSISPGILSWLVNVVCFIWYWGSIVFREYIFIDAFSITAVVFFILSLIFALSSYKSEPNEFFGIRIPATYDYPEVWSRVHRFYSIVTVYFLPAQFLLLLFFNNWLRFGICIALLMLPIFISVIYANIIVKPYIKKEEQELREQIRQEEYPRF